MLATAMITILFLHAVIAVPLIFRLLRNRFEPTAMLVWLLTIALVPLLGALLYDRLGENRVMLRAQRKRSWSAHPTVPRSEWEIETDTLGRFKSAADVGVKLANAQVTQGNDVQIEADCEAIHVAWKEAIESAEVSLDLEFYIWWPDETGIEIRDLVIRRFKDGIACRVLIDSIGSLRTKRQFLTPFYDAGVPIAFFLPLANWKRRWSPHLRNHRKILLVDRTTAFIGSQNISDEDRGRSDFYPCWHNVHLRIVGPAVGYIQAIFLDDWAFASGETDLESIEPVERPTDPGRTIQILPTGPDRGEHVLERMLLEAFNNARDTIDIVTPYFVPSAVLRMGMLQAALRGVHVRIVVPGKSDQRLALYAARSFYGELLEGGIEILEYMDGMLHSKIIAVDSTWAMLGSANVDYRSLRLNFEVSALLYDAVLAKTCEQIIDGYCEPAERITLASIKRKPTRQLLLEGAARVVSPQL